MTKAPPPKFPPDAQEGKGRFARWSEAKQAERAAEDHSRDQSQDQSQDQSEGAELASAQPDAQTLASNQAAAEAVDLATLNKDSDLSVFFREGVPDMLRKQALASLWRSNPIYANVDGLVDYGQDFGDPKLIMKTFVSAYQAGRGYLKHIVEEELDAPKDSPVAGADDPEGRPDGDADAASDPEGPDSQTPDMASAPTAPEGALKGAPEGANVRPPEPSAPRPTWPEPAAEEGQPVDAPRKVSLRRRLNLDPES